ncbi:MAG: hypothetical protein OEX00_10615 [Gammaproteobacteria bacterium]|nr:hypothetical protein [Gammaproteobacteria bacterium]MDH5692625.1 hypothetical protein [Gammaproteobacteria bacterium]
MKFEKYPSSEEKIEPRCFLLKRRGQALAWCSAEKKEISNPLLTWNSAQPVPMYSLLAQTIKKYKNEIGITKKIYLDVLKTENVLKALEESGRLDVVERSFDFVGTYSDVSDAQEIETLEFCPSDSENEEEFCWLRCAWLSVLESDRSLRFRFSHGMPDIEDVSLDLALQRKSSLLCDLIFPESKIITDSEEIVEVVANSLGVKRFEFLEKIVYFNAPDGGALFHHDVERGHLGVIYAQITGSTAWLALSSAQLLDCIKQYVSNSNNHDALKADVGSEEIFIKLLGCTSEPEKIYSSLNEREEELEILINNSSSFTKYLIDSGHGYLLEPGDVIFLPQFSVQECAWHSVFCVGEETGEALSFAIRASE